MDATTCIRANGNHQCAASVFIIDDERQHVPPQCTDLPTKPFIITSQTNVILKFVVWVLLTEWNRDSGSISTGTRTEWRVRKTDDEVRHRHGQAHQSTHSSHQSNCVHPDYAQLTEVRQHFRQHTTLDVTYETGNTRSVRPSITRQIQRFQTLLKGKHTKIHIKMEERMRKGYEYCVNSIVQHTHISITVRYKSNSYKHC